MASSLRNDDDTPFGKRKVQSVQADGGPVKKLGIVWPPDHVVPFPNGEYRLQRTGTVAERKYLYTWRPHRS